MLRLLLIFLLLRSHEQAARAVGQRVLVFGSGAADAMGFCPRIRCLCLLLVDPVFQYPQTRYDVQLWAPGLTFVFFIGLTTDASWPCVKATPNACPSNKGNTHSASVRGATPPPN